MHKTALITGITGQDGAYLARFLLEKGYVVHGIKRRSSSFNTSRIDDIYVDPHLDGAKLFLHYGDLTDSTNLIRIIQETSPDEIYNLGAQSHVQVSFETPEYTANSDAMGTLRILEAIRILGLEKKTKFYQASTSEMYGKVQEIPQSETTPFYPRSPYGVAKLYAYWITINYREAYGMFAANGILFNHESPMRGETFVTRKITRAAAAISLGLEDTLYLGNLDAKRDWGHAKDYVEGMWKILQHDTPDDFVLGTGETHTVRELAEIAFAKVGIPLEWSGQGVDEIGKNTKTGEVIIRIDPRYFRPTEVELLIADPSKAKDILGWHARISFSELIEEMVESDLKAAQKQLKMVKNSPNMVNKTEFALKNKRIWVAGHRGMVGSAICRRLESESPAEILTATRAELDLTDQAAVNSWMAKTKPDAIFLAAAKVGGIHANDSYPAEFLYENLAIANHVIHAAHENEVEKLLFLGSSCIYPKLAEQPITEDSLLTGPLEPTNAWYAIAKIAGIKLCEAYRKQYGRDFISAMPTNLYGPGDNFHLENSHVIPGLIRRAVETKAAGGQDLPIWGSGKVYREFMHVDDCADALVFLMKHYSAEPHINIGTGSDVTILALAQAVMAATGLTGTVKPDPTKPDGTPRKLMDNSKLAGMGWSPKIDLAYGLAETVAWYLAQNKANLRN